jgi:hypothetical protein
MFQLSLHAPRHARSHDIAWRGEHFIAVGQKFATHQICYKPYSWWGCRIPIPTILLTFPGGCPSRDPPKSMPPTLIYPHGDSHMSLMWAIALDRMICYEKGEAMPMRKEHIICKVNREMKICTNTRLIGHTVRMDISPVADSSGCGFHQESKRGPSAGPACAW